MALAGRETVGDKWKINVHSTQLYSLFVTTLCFNDTFTCVFKCINLSYNAYIILQDNSYKHEEQK